MITSKEVKNAISKTMSFAAKGGSGIYTPYDALFTLTMDSLGEIIEKLYGKDGLNIFRTICMKMASEYPRPAYKSGTAPVPSPEMVMVQKTLLMSSADLTQKLYGDYEAHMPAFFISLCMTTENFSFDTCLMMAHFNKDDIYYEMLAEDLKSRGKEVPAKESLKIKDFLLKNGERPRQTTRPLGTFLSSVETEKKEVKNETKLWSEDQGFLTNLVKESENYTKPFIGREDIINRTLQVLCRKEKGNPLHIGEPGVGKTAITKGLAKKIANDQVPDSIKGSSLYALNLTRLAAGSSLSGEYEQRICHIFEDLEHVDKPIVYIDEIHTIFSSGTSSMHDLGSTLKPFLLDPHIKVIGATTFKEYNQYIKKDPAFERRFIKIDITEPTIEQAKEIAFGLKKQYEEYHKVKYSDEAIEAAVELSARHLHSRFLPDKAIDIIDEAGAWAEVTKEKGKEINVEDIKEQMNKSCGIPVNALKNEKEIVKTLDDTLKTSVFGQDEAIREITTMMQIAKAGLNNDEKPIGSFLFVGPSGVGKTELAKSLAAILGIDFIRFDMSEYAEAHAVSKLFGAPAGYVGYDNGGLLTNEVQKKPHSVVLLDEIEKAHPEIFKSFLQILDYGILTDSQGIKTDFRNTVIIFTSNAGASDSGRRGIGFGAGIDTSAMERAVEQTFSVEFRNRLDAIITFNSLSENVSVMIANKGLGELKNKLAKQGYTMTVTDRCIKEIAKRGTSPAYGAREIGRIINGEIKQIISKELIFGRLPKSFIMDYEDSFIIKEEIKEEIFINNKVKNIYV